MLFRKPIIGIALAGGGAKGIPIDIISGTSIGAVIGAAYALAPDIEKLKATLRILIESDVFRDLKLDKFKSVEEDNWFDRIRNRLRLSLTFAEAATRPSLVPELQVLRLFDELFGDKTFEDTELPFAAVALDLISGKDVIFREGLIRDAVRASTAIPGIFPTVKLNGKKLVDGGITANAPVRAARELGADIVIGVIFGYEPSPPGKLESSMSVILRGDELAKLKLFRMLIEKADYIVEIDTGNTHWTDFGIYEECIVKGKEAAIRNLDQLKRISSGSLFRKWFSFKQRSLKG